VQKSQYTTTTKTQALNSLAEPRTELGTSRTAVRCLSSRPLKQLNISNKIDLFQRNGLKHKHTKPKLRATPYQQSRYFCHILTCMFSNICQFLIFSGIGFAA